MLRPRSPLPCRVVLALALGGCRATCGPDPHTPAGPMPSFDENDPGAHERAQWQRGFEQTTQGPTSAPVRVDPIAVGGAAAVAGAGITGVALGMNGDGGAGDAQARDRDGPLPHLP